ncbi:class III extradiol dioxygenase subunit B-like domain-containing protein [Streptomyces johnsoniae]|uniref:Class III extradiol dioxygenase subunit B-like domain-containing protein n=1 Tax=Streptomyces johnsoniae TaxID=3075532 RepID=A0ABU2SB38_9ACTN|nr:class III extradiol dioxygenase subunit B-like domain-containing protein [Streptomyces sp. DSM 41886]MDT0446181.1 class III extradiol dioxygenase subunit B-like domain-containing protein [Streptomyces sp. DSM 41886]
MLVAAAVCPCPPLLVPEVAGGAAPELDDARAACTDAVGVLAASRPDRLVLVGPAGPAGLGAFPAGARGSLRGFGVDVAARLGEGEPGERELPPSLTIGAWLLERTGWRAAPVEGLGIAGPLDGQRAADLGRDLAAGTDRLALLVMGDGSACRSPRAPGAFDERAAAFDAAVARALGDANTAALAMLDARLAEELHAAGRPGWQLLAGAAEEAGLGGRLLYDSAPYGVGYFVASWS